MRKVITILMLAVLTALWVDPVYAGEKEPMPRPAGEVTSVPSGEGWADLFDANNATLWKVDAENLFEFQDGQMHIFGHKPTHYIQYTGDTYGDFQVHLEFKLTVKANSGLMFRAAPEDPVFKGMEIQIIDSYGEDPNYSSCGALYDVAAPMFNMVNKTGEWNSLDLTVQGKHIVAVVNNWKVLDLDVSKMTMPIPFSTLVVVMTTKLRMIPRIAWLPIVRWIIRWHPSPMPSWSGWCRPTWHR